MSVRVTFDQFVPVCCPPEVGQRYRATISIILGVSLTLEEFRSALVVSERRGSLCLGKL